MFDTERMKGQTPVGKVSEACSFCPVANFHEFVCNSASGTGQPVFWMKVPMGLTITPAGGDPTNQQLFVPDGRLGGQILHLRLFLFAWAIALVNKDERNIILGCVNANAWGV